MTDEPREFPEVPLTGVTELRIHGVSGTPVESMLKEPHPVQVWGDGTAGFYRRPVDGNDGTDHVEAYSWGGLTAGASARAAWLLLLPFTLVNVASWAHPARGDAKRNPVDTMSAVLRVLALTLTLTFVLSIALISMDVLAWQCANDATGCGGQHWYTRWMTDFGPGVRVVVGALVPLGFIGLVWKLSKSTSAKYEDMPPVEITDAAPATVRDVPGRPVPPGVRDMAQPKFWYGGGPVARLRHMHLAASVALVAMLVAFAAALRDGRTGPIGGAVTFLSATLVLLVALGLASPRAGRRRELFDGEKPAAWYCRAVSLAAPAAFALLAVAIVYALWIAHPDEGGTLPGGHGAKQVLVIAQLVLLAVLFGANVLAHRRRDRAEEASTYGAMLKGQLATFLAVLAAALAGAFAAGLTLRVADYLGCPTTCAEDNRVEFSLPLAYTLAGRAFGACVVVAVVLGITHLVKKRFTKLPPQFAEGVVAEYPGHTDPKRRAQIAEIHAGAALTDRASRLLAVTVVGGIGIGFALSLAYGPIAEQVAVNADADFGWFYDVVYRSVLVLFTLGAWLVGAFALGLVVLGRLAYRNPAMRRTVGILWDLGTFWPRAVHPFAPPCYCERTIPEFSRRIEQLTDGGGRVVVSAHSQGTVIAFAALLQLTERADSLALLTYGSPLHRLYARAFPHFFGLPVLDWGNAMLGERWINLYRRSDPIGGPVAGADADVPLDAVRPDRRLHDPAFAMPEYAFDYPVARGHSNYFQDPAFAASVAALAAEVRGDAVSADDVVPAQQVAKRVRAG